MADDAAQSADRITIRPLRRGARGDGQAETVHCCARWMADSEPWITLGRGYEASLALLSDSSREVYLAWEGETLRGFLILCMVGAFVGYIQTVCVAPEARGAGVGSALVRFAEERIFRESPNSFLCVSSFNPRAKELYERLGYRQIGELDDYLMAGHSEILMRKTIAPLAAFRQAPPGNATSPRDDEQSAGAPG